MRRALLVYHTSEGHTADIAARIAEVLRGAGLDVDVTTAESSPDPRPYDLVVVGDSIHVARHSRQLIDYCRAWAAELNARAFAVFQVSLTSAVDDSAHTTEAMGLLHKLFDLTGIDPDLVGVFAGALLYTRYGWFKRHLMASIARRELDETDTSTDRDYTDWQAVDAFAADAAVLLHGDGLSQR